MNEIKFLHISDLHFGDRNQRELFSQTKKILFEDIEFIFTKIKTLDIVFFTGDLVQKGSKDEFTQLEEFLIELWQLFKKYNQNPSLVCVPGNHDLERINDSKHPTLKVLNNWVNEDIKDDYFWTKSNQYHDFIKERFYNYTEWYKNTSIKKPENITNGFLPGDFHCTIIKDGFKFGIVGLNSSFLQLIAGNFKRRLGVYNKQIYNLFNEKYFEWLNSNNASILLTHHSPEWFEPKSGNEFHQEIYSKDSYIDHLCGHLHEPSYTNISSNGFPSKRLSISPSLFGLEHFEDSVVQNRIHGYNAGIYKFESGKITKTIWPRISHITKSKVLKIIQNDEFNLDKTSLSFSEVIEENQDKNTTNKIVEEKESIDTLEDKGGNLFANKTLQDKGLARTFYKSVPSHMGIRQHDRIRALKKLDNQKNCWIVTKFGLGEDEFIGSLIVEANINSGNCFSINCEDSYTIEDLIDSFKSTFSQNITEFFDTINTLDRPLLVFNKLNDELVQSADKIKELSQTIFDFTANVKIIIVSTTKPDQFSYESIDLSPLEVPAVKQFVECSQELNSTFTFLEFEKIHRLSSGIPLYIDKVIDQLKFRPLSDLGDMEFENSSSVESNNSLAKAIRNEIDILHGDESKPSNRKFLLLTILSLLHNGETFERIRRFDSSKPFHPEDISYLLKNKLIETVQVNSIFNQNQIDSEVIKIIKVPRIIRDYVSSLISDEEKIEIYKQACNIYLGNKWRDTIKLIQPKDAELDLIVHQNLQISIRFILSYGIEQNKELEISRMTRVSISLINYFSDRGSYKDAISLIEETLLLIKDVEIKDFDDYRTFLTRKLGENLRMTAFHEKSIDILREICDNENNSLSKNDRNDIRLSIAYAYETLGKKEEALEYADLIKKNEKDKNSNIYLSAESVVIHFIENEAEKLRKLNALKNKTNKLGYSTLNANIILEICRINKEESNIKQLDKIIKGSNDDVYNKVRAWASKAEIILNSKSISEISNEDLLGLNIAYSYSFYQRLLSILDKCHWLAWQYWSQQNRYDQLLNIFRYSSFVWRLCGKQEHEQICIDELHSNKNFIEWFKSNKFGINSIYYEQRIFALYKNGNEKKILELNE